MDGSLAGFQSTNDLAKQLITLSTGSLALSITFTKDIIKSAVPVVTWPLKIAWVAWLLSVCFGIWTMMAVTGMVFKITEKTGVSESVTYGENVSIPALLQILMFVVGIVLLIVHGAKMLRVTSESNAQSETPHK